MPVNETDYVPGPAAPRRSRPVAWIAIAIVTLVAGVVVLAVRGTDPQGRGEDREHAGADEGHDRTGQDADRVSSGLPSANPERDAADDAAGTTATSRPVDGVLPDSGGFVDPRNPPVGRRGSAPSTGPGTEEPTDPAGAGGTGGAGRGSPTGASPRPVSPTPEPVSPRPTVPAPVATSPGTTTVVLAPKTTPATTPPPSEPEPEPEYDEVPPPPHLAHDERACPNLGLQAIGGDDVTNPLRATFRALLPELTGSEDLVCGEALEPWRDLTIQHLMAGGQSVGTIITATDGSSIAMRLADNEWAGYRYRYGGGPVGFNFLGAPVERMTLGGVEIIRTTTGGLVMPATGVIGIPVVAASWDFWMLHGGPSGEMGVPLSLPTGIIGYGAYQDFTNGRMTLPGVTTDIEAWAAPLSRYEWHPRSEFPYDPIDLRHHIVEVTGVSYYIDDDGVAHWIATQSDWMCARWDLGALPIVIPGYILGSFPIGTVFDCPNR